MQSPRKDYTPEFKRRVGVMLLEKPWITQTIIARCLEVTPRTMNNWKRNAARDWPVRGPVPKKIGWFEMIAIAREWRRQGCPGHRPVIAALGTRARARAVKFVIKELKLRKEERRKRLLKSIQVRVKVKKPGTVMTFDGATIKKGDDHIVYRDRGSLSVETKPCVKGNLTAEDTLEVLVQLKIQNRLPFVCCTDNGSPLCAKMVEDFLDKNHIIHLKSLPRVPQHNGSCENAVKEFKELIKDGYHPLEATEILNERRKRSQLCFKTSAEFDKENFRQYTEGQRKEFYEAAKAAIQVAQLDKISKYDKRKAEREAIFQTMEGFSLITRTRGGQLRPSGPEESL